MKKISIPKPQHFYQYILLLFIAILVASSWNAYRNLRANLDQTIVISADQLEGQRNIYLDSDEQTGKLIDLNFKEKNARDATLVIRLKDIVKTGVLELELGPTQAFKSSYIRVFYAPPPNKKGHSTPGSLNIKSNRWLPLRGDNTVYRIPLYRDIPKNHIILQIKSDGPITKIPINSLKIKPATFFDFPAGALIICIGTFLAVFLPGLLVALSNPKLNILPLPVTAFLYSLGLSLCALTICLITQIHVLFLPILFVLTTVLIILTKTKQQSLKENISSIFSQNIPDLNVWVLLVVLISVSISYIYPSPIQNIHQGHLTKEHTLKAFGAHDAVFQYYNGKAILENDFDKYYNNKKLWFYPEDREILPGLSYAAIKLFVKPIFGENISKQYFIYAVFFLLSHALALSMLFAWLKPLDIKLAYITTLFVATTPVFWTLAMIGWFKLTGAALILGGVYVIKDNPQLLSRWIIAGILFGLAKNYHGSNALVLPVLTIWLLCVTYKTTRSISFTKLGISFVSLTTFACIFIYPWAWFVKHFWNTTTHKLFSSHFLGGHNVKASLLQSIQLFFEKIPLSEQLGVRFERTIGLFNPEWFLLTLAQYQMETGGLISGWLRFSASYLFPAIALYAFLATCVVLIVKLAIPKNQRQPIDSNPWFNQFGWMCFINMIFLTFISYNRPGGYAAINWEMSTILFIGVLCHFIIWSCKQHRDALLFWLCFCFLQLGVLLSYG